MDILNETKKDKVSIHAEKEVEAKQKLMGRIIPKKGHTLFEINLTDQGIRKATFEQLVYDGTNTRKVLMNPNCVYVSCLNIKNVPKHLKKVFGIDVATK